LFPGFAVTILLPTEKVVHRLMLL